MLKEILRRWLKQCAPKPAPKTEPRKLPFGVGLIGDRNIPIKRKFRWLMEADLPSGGRLEPTSVRVSNRPAFTVDSGGPLSPFSERPDNSITTIFEYWSETYVESFRPLFTYFETVYNFSGYNAGTPVNSRHLTLTLTMTDGTGEPLERWVLHNAWPMSVNFGELDFSSSDNTTVEVLWRYSRVNYTQLTPPVTPSVMAMMEPWRNSSSESGSGVLL